MKLLSKIYTPAASHRRASKSSKISPSLKLRSLALYLLIGLTGAGVLAVLSGQSSGGYQAVSPVERQRSHPPIPIPFHLDKSAYVTLVIENDQGQRVRNLVSETLFPAGDNTAWWDGLDDLGRDVSSAARSIYSVPGTLVEPGTYTVRGLYRQAIDLKYEFAVYNPGQPPWMTKNTSSEWLANHTPPEAVCFIPAGRVPVHGQFDSNSPAQILVGSHVTEGGSGLAWLDLNGRKLHGQMWVGGVWSGAEMIARDLGPGAIPGVYAYLASSWGELRLRKLVNGSQQRADTPRDTRMGTGEDLAVLNPNWKFPSKDREGIGGLAAYNGLLVVSLPKMNQLLFVDALASRVLGSYSIPHPRGLYADSKGNLFIVSGKSIVQAQLPDRPSGNANTNLSTPHVLLADSLADPQQITMDAASNLYVSDWGSSNQVKVFSPSGKFLRAIGSPGVPSSGPYDRTLMHHPKGITIDDKNQLWVAEEDFQPKRLSVWNLNGQFVRAFYGPPTYGGGGNLDPQDKTLFYLNGMTFRLNWDTGTSDLIRIQYRPKYDEAELVPKTIPDGKPIPPWQEPGSRNKKFGASERPDLPIYFESHKYFTNSYNTSPVSGVSVVGLWLDRNGIAKPTAAFGNAEAWQLLETPSFKSHIEALARQHADPRKTLDLSGFTFVWSDLNDDGIPQPAEVKIAPGRVGTATLSSNLKFATDTALSYEPVSFTPAGAPVYDLNQAKLLATGTQRPASSGGGQVLPSQDGRVILTTAPKPFMPQSLAGAESGRAKWSYPSLWPGLHASHTAPMPQFPGELIGTTRLLGPTFKLHNSNDIELWAINGNKGNIYLLTTDGLLVATLFKDSRIPAASWAKQLTAQRGMSVSELTAGEENFWPSITETSDGNVYVVTNYSAIIRVDGLDTIRRLAPQTIQLTPDLIQKAELYLASRGISQKAATQQSAAATVPIHVLSAKVDGDISKWEQTQFVTIDDKSGSGREAKTQAAIIVGGDRLYVALRTGDPHALDNSGIALQNLFKTGGALDLMLGTDPNADNQRKSPVPGDIRLLIALVGRRPTAVLYRPVATTGPRETALFESPLRTVKFDDVEDVSPYLQFAASSKSPGDFEFSIPLNVLGLKPVPGQILRGDIGLLRGDGVRTTQRVYWSNKTTGIVSDIPTEAVLTPQFWGTLKFVQSSDAQH